ncbi:unannotated protein [freshwater metagenome]|uniref:Unannotated protein n=1 Tax=freshwater metagenome TaxID=449393 RepID=A0A6J7ALL8_9ZZZZ
MVDALAPAFFTGMDCTALFFATAFFTGAFFAGAFFTGAFVTAAFLTGFFSAVLAGAFFATAFLTGFLGMTRTLCRLPRLYQLRHKCFYPLGWPRLSPLTRNER